MKKTLSLVLALALAVSMFASFALIVPGNATNDDPFTITGIKVTDAAGYAAAYAAVDSAAAFVENQAAYVVASFVLRDDVNYDVAIPGTHTTTVTSSTLDLSYADSTFKGFTVAVDGTITPTAPITVTDSNNEVTMTYTYAAGQPVVEDDVIKYFVSFVAVTKPATAGEVKASLKVAGKKFVDSASGTTLFVYDSTGLKYIIERTIDPVAGDSFMVQTWSGISGAAYKELFSYENDALNAKFSNISKGGFASRVDFFGKIWDTKGTADQSDDVDITDTVNAVNAFFGFSFANTDYPVLPKHFEAKTVGNPIVVTDTYAYVTAVVTDGDNGVDIAPTGDFSANIVIVMAASAVLAAAALAFVAKKARD